MMYTRKTQGLAIVCAAPALLLVAGGAQGQCVPEWSNEIGTPGMADGNIAAFATYSDDGCAEDLYAIGSFTSADGNPDTSLIAKWTGTEWVSVGGGLAGQFANTLGVFNGDLIAGGYFDSAGGVAGTEKLARWDGTQWYSMNAQLENFVNSVWGLKTWDDGTGEALYVAGNYVDIGGNPDADFIAKWDGLNYTPLGAPIGGAVPLIIFDVEVWDDGTGEALYAGGRFITIDGVTANRIAKWDGQQWHPLGNGIAQTSITSGVYTMEVWDDGSGESLFVAGQRIDEVDGLAVADIARWDGEQWHDVGGGTNNTIWDLRVFDAGDGNGEALYAVGLFTEAGGQPAGGVAKWDGQQWSGVGAQLNDSAFGAIVWNDSFFVGGSFTSVNGSASNRVGEYVGCPTTTPGDIDGDGDVDVEDLLALLSEWGQCGSDADLDGNDTVDVADLLILLANWG
jgi:hypothetical protein